MAWFLINIILPIAAPLVYLLGAKLVDLPEPYASRAKLIRAVQDGQLGWVATVFAAASLYELSQRLQDLGKAALWAQLMLAISCASLAISGFLAVLGTLYPLKESKLMPTGWRSWCRHYRLFITSLLATLITAALFSLAHFAFSISC